MTIVWFQSDVWWILTFDHPLGGAKKIYWYETEAKCIEVAHNILAWYLPMYGDEYQSL